MSCALQKCRRPAPLLERAMIRRTVGEILERPRATFYIGLLDLFGRELKGAGYARQKITGAEGCEFVAESAWPLACAVAVYSAAVLGKESE